ncbi:MAG: helix-turn-helix domain-containing protein [Clostridiales bacterium]|nr:helix-turn-helix domain-containing protein [Clostridiales bacterium]
MDVREMMQGSIDYIEQNLKAELNAGELAERAGFSMFHYYRLFQAATGMPVMQYILRRRLLHAIYHIHLGQKGIDAALNYGFDTYAGFYRAFRRMFGCTPAQFLRRYKAREPAPPNLIKEEHIVITHQKAMDMLRHWGLTDQPVADIFYEGTGNHNDNAYYVGDAYVLKFTANLGRLKNHIALSKAIAQAGLSSSIPVPAEDDQEILQDGELFFCLTRRIPGRQLAADALYQPQGADVAQRIGQSIGRLHRALCTVEAPVQKASLNPDWALSGAKHVPGLDEAFCAAALETMKQLYPKLPRQIIHRDPNPGNLISDGEQWGFIDFELSEENVRIFDPCYAATAILSETFFSDDSARLEQWLAIYHRIMQGYDQAAVLTPEERRAVPYVLFANQLCCVAWFAQQDRYPEAFEVNKRMTRWIARYFDQLTLA